MLQKIVFHDNIYQLSRSIDVLNEGLMLDLSPEYFLDKTVDDLLFFDMSIQKLYNQIQANSQLSDYITIMHNLYSCQNNYIKLISFILSGKTSMNEEFFALRPKLNEIKAIHISLQSNLIKNIHKSDKNNDSHDIVSQNELSELLHF